MSSAHPTNGRYAAKLQETIGLILAELEASLAELP